MLSVPTLWTVFVINFLALGLIWAYVMRSYPKFEAARFWTGSAFAAAAGAALATLRFATDWDSLVPLLAGGTVLIFAGCLATMGVKRFYGRPASWRGTALISGLSCAGLAFFIFGYDSMPMRILIYSVGQSLPFALTLKLLLSRQNGRANPGGRSPPSSPSSSSPFMRSAPGPACCNSAARSPSSVSARGSRR